MKNLKKVSKIVTHNGVFHADDVFAVAVLHALCFVPYAAEIIRIPNHLAAQFASFEDAILVDVGGGEFDHHGKGNEKFRDDNTPYAAFGLVWNAFGRDYVRAVASDWLDEDYLHGVPSAYKENLVESVFADIDERLVRHIDARDNGIGADGECYSITNAISAFNPDWTTDIADQAEFRDSFLSALDFAGTVLKNESLRLASSFAADAHVTAAVHLAKDGVVVLPRFLPWKEMVVAMNLDHEVKFVVYPSKNGYDIAAVPPAMNRMFDQIVQLPEVWRGLSGEDLAHATGVADAVFCHNGGFQAAARSLEGALSLARSAIAAS